MLRFYFANRRNKKLGRANDRMVEAVHKAKFRDSIFRIADCLEAILKELKKGKDT